MSEPFLAEIRIFSFQQAPVGWAQCNGQFLPINQNQALFSLLGTMYGGNGQTTFALPDLRSRVPLHEGSSFPLAQSGGQEFHTVTISELPEHVHFVQATKDNATTNTPSAAVGYARAGTSTYGDPVSLGAMSPASVGNIGGSQPHENRQPYLVLNFCIALSGVFPSQA